MWTVGSAPKKIYMENSPETSEGLIDLGVNIDISKLSCWYKDKRK